MSENLLISSNSRLGVSQKSTFNIEMHELGDSSSSSSTCSKVKSVVITTEARRRWLSIKRNLKKLVEMDQLEFDHTVTKEDQSSSKPHPINRCIEFSAFLRVLLLALVFLCAFGITGYQWSQWYQSTRQSIYFLSDKITYHNAEQIRYQVNTYLSRSRFVLDLNSSLYSNQFSNWVDYSLKSVGKNLDVLYNQCMFATKYDDSFSQMSSVFIATDDADCDGGRYLSVVCDFTDGADKMTSIVRDPTLTQCFYANYELQPTIGNRWSTNISDFIKIMDGVPSPQNSQWYKQAKAAATIGWTTATLSPLSHILTVTAYKPFYSSVGKKALVGFLGADISVSVLSSFLANIQSSTKSGVIYIFSTDGTLVAASHGRLSAKDPVLRPISVIESSNPIIKNTSKSLFNSFGSFANITSFDNFRGADFLISARVLTDGFSNGLNWILVVAEDSNTYQTTDTNNLHITLYFGIPCYVIMSIVVVYIVVFSEKVEVTRVKHALKLAYQERQDRARKLALKRERERFQVISLDGKMPDYLKEDPNDDETFWLSLALEEEKNPRFNSMENSLELNLAFRSSSRVSTAVVYVILIVVLVNMTLWLIWMGTTRSDAVNMSETLVNSIRYFTSVDTENYLETALIPVARLWDLYLSSTGTLFKDLSSLSVTYSGIKPTTVPSTVQLLQNILCNLRQIYNVPYLYVGLETGVMLGCFQNVTNVYILTNDVFNNGMYVGYPASSTFQRMSPRSVINSVYDPRRSLWYTSAKVQTNALGVFTGPYLFSAGTSVGGLHSVAGVTFSYPIVSLASNGQLSNDFIGVIGADFDLSVLSDMVTDKDLFLTGMTMFILDEQDQVIAVYSEDIIDPLNANSLIQGVSSIDKSVSSAVSKYYRSRSDDAQFSIFTKHDSPVLSVSPIPMIPGSFWTIQWKLFMSIPNISLYLEADKSARFTFWLLFTEFSVIATLASMFVGRVSLDSDLLISSTEHSGDRQSMEIEFEYFLKGGMRLRQLETIEKIYERVSKMRRYYLQDEMRSVETDSSSDELSPERHQAWLNYLNSAYKNYNVENVWMLKHLYGPNSKSLFLYQFETSFLYRAFIYLMTIGLCIMAFFEPSNWAIFYPTSSINWGVMYAELFFILCIIFDTILQTFSAIQLKSFKWNHFITQVFFSGCFLADWIGYAAAGVPRWSRLLRPLSFVYHVPQIRSVALLVIQSMMSAQYVILLFFYVIIVASITAIPLVGDLAVYQTDGDFPATTFNNFYSSFVNMFILIASSLNYADCFDPTIQVSRWYMVFWVTITIVGSFFILSTLIAQFSNTYSEYFDAKKKASRARRRMALAATFIIFDTQNKGRLSRRDFTICVATYLRTKYSHFDRLLQQASHQTGPENETISKASSNAEASHILNIKGLPSFLADVLYGAFHVIDTSGDGFISVDEFEKGLDLAMLSYAVSSHSRQNEELSKSIIYFIVFRFAFPIVLLLYVVVLAAYSSAFIGSEPYLDIALSCLLGLMMSEVILRIGLVYRGVRGYWNEYDSDTRFTNRQDLILVSGSFFSAIGLWAYAIQQKSYQPFSGTNTIYRSLLCIAALRIFTIHRFTRRVAVVLIELAPSCFEIMVLVIVAFYEYASLGGVFFSGIQFPPRSINFDNFLNSWIFMYWLYIADSWNVPMGQAIVHTSNAALWFFITWAFLVTTMLSNLLIGVVIMMFTDFLNDQTKRLIDPQIRDILTKMELHELRTMSEMVLLWVDHRQSNDVVRANRALSSLKFGFGGSKDSSESDEKMNMKQSTDGDGKFIPRNLSELQVSEIADLNHKLEIEICNRKVLGLLTDEELHAGDTVEMRRRHLSMSSSQAQHELHKKFLNTEQSLVSEKITTQNIFSGGDVIESREDFQYLTPAERREIEAAAEKVRKEKENQEELQRIRLADEAETLKRLRELAEITRLEKLIPQPTRNLEEESLRAQWETYKNTKKAEQMAELESRKTAERERRLDAARERLRESRQQSVVEEKPPSSPLEVTPSQALFRSIVAPVADSEISSPPLSARSKSSLMEEITPRYRPRGFGPDPDLQSLRRQKSSSRDSKKNQVRADVLRSIVERSKVSVDRDIDYAALVEVDIGLGPDELRKAVDIAIEVNAGSGNKLSQSDLRQAIVAVDSVRRLERK